MSEVVRHPDLPGYVSIKQAADILGIDDRTMYYHVESGHLPVVWAADVLMIAIKDLENFELQPAGRPRKNVPPWRISAKANIQYLDVIHVRMKAGREKELTSKLEEIRREGKHLFPGTVERAVASSQTEQGEVVIVLIWRGVVMPDAATRQQQLEAFKQDLADILDWSTARHEEAVVLLHT